MDGSDADGNTSHTVDVFDSLRLRGASYDAATNDYEQDVGTESDYLGGVARRRPTSAYVRAIVGLGVTVRPTPS